MVVVKKYIDVYKHGELINETIWNFFFLTNDTQSSCCQIVLSADGRCNQENMILSSKMVVILFELVWILCIPTGLTWC